MSFWDTTKKEVGGFWDGINGVTRYSRSGSLQARAKTLARAISQVESGGKQVRGASGEFGSFQFMPATWASVSKQVAGKVLQQTPANEQMVAEKKIQQLLDRGFDERQVALIWNTSLGGAETPREISGVNKFGVKYDSGAYANKVQRAFQAFSMENPVENTPHGIALNTVKGLPQAAGEVAGGFWGGVSGLAKGIAKGAGEFGLSAGEAVPRLVNPRLSTTVLPPTNVPGLSRFTGPLQSFQSKAAQEVQEGSSVAGAVGRGTLDVALNEPIGFAAKPLFIGAGVVGKLLSTELKKYVTEQTAKAPANTLFRDILKTSKTKLVDFASPIEDVLAKTTKKSKITLNPTEDINNNIARVLRAPTLAAQFVKDNGFDKVIQGVDDLKTFDQYLIARHAKDLEARGIKTGRNSARDAELVQTLDPAYKPFADKVRSYSQALLDRAVETGLVSREVAELLKERYPNYVPFQRVFDAVDEYNAGQGGIASLSRQSIVRRIEGSDRQIESPIESLLSKTNDLFRQGEKNLAAKTLAGYEKLPGNPFELRELAPGETAPHTISFLDNGKKKTYATTADVANAAKALNVQQLNILGQILALPVRIARLGITGINAPFLAANFAKDQVSALINTNHALRTSVANPSVFLPAFYNAIGHRGLYDEWVRAGGGGTSFDLSRNQMEKTVKDIRAGKDVPSRVLHTVTNPAQLLRAVEDIMQRGEELTRLQQYAGTKQALSKKGMSGADAIAGGARASRENTVDFARRGEWGQVLNSAFLYLNAGIQGTRTLLRNLKKKPVSTSAKIATFGFLPVAYATHWNLSDRDRAKAYEDILDYEKENNIIIIPPNPTKDEQGRWNIIKIPLSQEINDLVGLARRPMEEIYGMDPVGFQDAARALIGAVSPIEPTKGGILSSIVPQAIKPTIEGAVNRNLFTDIPQVPRSLENKPAEEQVKDYTSGTARQIGNRIGVSPIKVEQWIKGTFGGVGSQALNQIDHALATAGVIPEDQIGGQAILDAISARFNKARGGKIEQEQYEAEQKAAQEKAKVRAAFKASTYDPVQELIASGDIDGARKIVDDLSDEDYKVYVGIRQGERSKRTEEMRKLLNSDPKAAVKYVRDQEPGEALRLIKVMTDEEYAMYEEAKKGIAE